MDSKQLLELIKNNVNEFRTRGNEFISIDILLKYLNNLENDLPKIDKNYETYVKLQQEVNLAAYNTKNKFEIEKFRSVIQSGQAALKSAILINGGASVAILSFITQAWGKYPTVVSGISISLILFVVGTLLAAVSSGTGYLTNFYLHDNQKFYNIFKKSSWILVALSYLFFLSGAIAAFCFFKNQI